MNMYLKFEFSLRNPFKTRPLQQENGAAPLNVFCSGESRSCAAILRVSLSCGVHRSLSYRCSHVGNKHGVWRVERRRCLFTNMYPAYDVLRDCKSDGCLRVSQRGPLRSRHDREQPHQRRETFVPWWPFLLCMVWNIGLTCVHFRDAVCFGDEEYLYPSLKIW